MRLEQLFRNLAIHVEAFATCRVADGWRLRLPALDWVTFHFVCDGSGSVGHGDGRVPVHRGSLVVVPPHLTHDLVCGSSRRVAEPGPSAAPDGRVPEHRAGPADAKGLTVVCGRVDVDYGPGLGLFDRLDEVLLLDFGDSPDVRAVFERLRAEEQSQGPGSGAMMSALMSQGLVHVFRRLYDQSDHGLPWLQALEDPDLARVIDHVHGEPAADHSVASLAAIAYMSRATFARRFREAFGRTPMQYVREVRLRHGARLLRRDPPIPIRVVANRAGFGSRSAFSRAFSDRFGTSPTEFRDAPPA